MRLPAFSAETSAAEARALFTEGGWREVARGDWSWVFVSPDGKEAARLTPWDDAYLMHAEACLARGPHPHFPRIDAIVSIAGDGYVVVMERLFEAPFAGAANFCAALGFPAAHDGEPIAPDDGAVAALQKDPYIASARVHLEELLSRGAAMLPFWGGSDIRPGNVMRDEAGVLKAIDPIFVRGPLILKAIQDGDAGALGALSRRKLEAFLDIPAFAPGPETDALRAKLKALYA